MREMIVDGQIRNGVCVVMSESFGGGKLRYKLLREESVIEDEVADTYGIEIDCGLFGGEENIRVSDITANFGYAKELFELVSTNLVTPTSLSEVVEDFLESKYC